MPRRTSARTFCSSSSARVARPALGLGSEGQVAPPAVGAETKRVDDRRAAAPLEDLSCRLARHDFRAYRRGIVSRPRRRADRRNLRRSHRGARPRIGSNADAVHLRAPPGPARRSCRRAQWFPATLCLWLDLQPPRHLIGIEPQSRPRPRSDPYRAELAGLLVDRRPGQPQPLRQLRRTHEPHLWPTPTQKLRHPNRNRLDRLGTDLIAPSTSPRPTQILHTS